MASLSIRCTRIWSYWISTEQKIHGARLQKPHTHQPFLFLSFFSQSAACCEVNSWPFKAVCRWIFASWKNNFVWKSISLLCFCFRTTLFTIMAVKWMHEVIILDEMNSNRAQGSFFLRNQIFRQEFPSSSVCIVHSVLNSIPFLFIKMCTTL